MKSGSRENPVVNTNYLMAEMREEAIKMFISLIKTTLVNLSKKVPKSDCRAVNQGEDSLCVCHRTKRELYEQSATEGQELSNYRGLSPKNLCTFSLEAGINLTGLPPVSLSGDWN